MVRSNEQKTGTPMKGNWDGLIFLSIELPQKMLSFVENEFNADIYKIEQLA